MNEAEQSNRDMAVFTEALLLPAAERPAYLERTCGNDLELRRRVEALLRAHDQAGDFMEQPPLENPLAAGSDASPLEKPGDRIGRYKLLQQIGEGGCGVVYMAEQEEPVRRRVALKIIKAGMDTKSVIARFEAERQALAMMDHPNIAKVLDAGATESGRPYFVMELVRGVKISDYCDEHSLTTGERLNLFIQVCQAVQHAHQKGIIHRDLKPSNILVRTTETGVPSPVVIDFGIAKATTNQRLTDKTLFTAFEMLIGTPAYMSPEQAVLGSVDVDTRTDIYSLGVLLYELLTSTTPFDAGELMKAGLDEVRRVIREREPIRPSARLSRMTKDDLTNIAHHRKVEPPKLIGTVHGDLDWIVMKALEKDRTRRYETANGLALDIQRYLSDETILARPPGTLYRFQKTVARHKVLFGGITGASLLLVASLVVISSSLAKERQARREADAALQQAEADKAKANAEAAKSQQVTGFLEEMLQGVGPSVALGRDTKMLREILDKAATRIGTKLEDQPMIQAELQNRIGNVYEQLGVYDQAEALHRAALATGRKLWGNDSKEVADTLNYLGTAQFKHGDLAGAEKAWSEMLEIRRKLQGNEHADVAAGLLRLAGIYYQQGKMPEAEARVREALAIRRKVIGNDSLEAAESLNAMGIFLDREGKFGEAETAQREVVAIRRKRLEANHPNLYLALLNLGVTLSAESKMSEAADCLREALAIARKIYGDKHVEVARTLCVLGEVLTSEGRLAEAEAAFREALAIQRLTWSDDLNYANIQTLQGLGVVLQQQGKLAEAEQIDRVFLTVARKLLPPDQAASALEHLVRVLAEQKKFTEADQLLAESISAAAVPTEQNVTVLMVRADYLARQGRWSEAAADMPLPLQYRPADHEVYRLIVPLLAELRDPAKYQLISEKILKEFGGSLTAVVVDQMAIASLVLPSPGADLARIEKMIAKANHAGLDKVSMPSYLGGQALLAYRQGRYAQAIEWARKPAEGVNAEMEVMLKAVVAMAQHQLGQKDEARITAAKAQEIVQHKLAPRGSNDLGRQWKEWVFAHALIGEATALIEPPTSASSPAVPPP